MRPLKTPMEGGAHRRVRSGGAREILPIVEPVQDILECFGQQVLHHPLDAVVGTVSSAGWGYRVGRNIATGFVDSAVADDPSALAVESLGARIPAQRVDDVLYDPQNERLKL